MISIKKAFVSAFVILLVFSFSGCMGSFPIASHTGVYALPAGSDPAVTVQSSTALSVPVSPSVSPYAFRKTNWGDSADQVIASEGSQPDASNGSEILYKNKTVFNKNCTLFFVFAGSKLASAGYDFAEAPADLNNCITDYDGIVAGLTNNYISPAQSGQLWNNEEFKNDPGRYALAVQIGDLTYASTWNLSQATIGCLLHESASGAKNAVSITVTWQPPASVPAPAASAPSQSAIPQEQPSGSPPPSSTPSGQPTGSPAQSDVPAGDSPAPSEDASPSPAATQTPSIYSFRNTNWGMTPNEVTGSESGQTYTVSGNGITYADVSFMNKDCSLFYVFDNGLLANGGYEFTPAPADLSGCIDDYNAMVAGISQQYGSPVKSEQLWNADEYKNDPDRAGLAVLAGDVVFRSVWNTGMAQIDCILYGYGSSSQKETGIKVSWQNPGPAAASGQTAPGYSFKKTAWGMTIYQVITSEGRQPDEKGGNYLIYKNEKYHNADCHVLYQFADSKLISGTYMIFNTHTNLNDYLSDYNTALSILTQSYGPPASSGQIWNKPDSRYKNHPENYGLAVLQGDLSCSSHWKSPQTEIDCVLSGSSSIVTVSITYRDPAAT